MSEELTEGFKSALIDALKVSLKWRFWVLLLLLFFTALKITDLIWDYQRSNALIAIDAKIDHAIQANDMLRDLNRKFDRNTRVDRDADAWRSFIEGPQHKKLILKGCVVCHEEHPFTDYDRFMEKNVK